MWSLRKEIDRMKDRNTKKIVVVVVSLVVVVGPCQH